MRSFPLCEVRVLPPAQYDRLDKTVEWGGKMAVGTIPIRLKSRYMEWEQVKWEEGVKPLPPKKRGGVIQRVTFFSRYVPLVHSFLVPILLRHLDGTLSSCRFDRSFSYFNFDLWFRRITFAPSSVVLFVAS